MPESRTHKSIKRRAAGKTGRTEVHIRGGRRLDAATKSRAVEVEKSGETDRIRLAARKLASSGRPQRILVVPQRDLKKAKEAMRSVGTTGTVKNLSGTKSEYVGARKVSLKTRKAKG